VQASEDARISLRAGRADNRIRRYVKGFLLPRLAAERWEMSILNHKLEEIYDEYFRAATLHPNWPEDLIHQAAIVGEEAGELLQAALKYTYEDGTRAAIRKEAIQTAAMCYRLLINL